LKCDRELGERTVGWGFFSRIITTKLQQQRCIRGI
jgi:hypothetical protein